MNRNEKLTALDERRYLRFNTHQVFSSEDSFANITGYQMIDLN